MNMPTTMRWIQQQWWYHIALAGLIVGGTAMFHCFEGHGNITLECVQGGLTAAGSYLFGAFQHSPGSASFNADGSPAAITTSANLGR